MRTYTVISVDELREVVRQEIDRAPRLYTIEEGAALMAISARTLRQWIAARRIPSVELSPGAVRITGEDVTRYIEEHRREAI